MNTLNIQELATYRKVEGRENENALMRKFLVRSGWIGARNTVSTMRFFNAY